MHVCLSSLIIQRGYANVCLLVGLRAGWLTGALYLLCYRGSYDLTGRVYATGAMGVPQALAVLSGDAGERVAYGDDRGSVLLLLCGSRELPARDLISTDAHKVRTYVRTVLHP